MSQPDLPVIPDTITPYIGWKSLLVQNGQLYSPTKPAVWPPQKKLVAECHQPRESLTWTAIKTGEPTPTHAHTVIVASHQAHTTVTLELSNGFVMCYLPTIPPGHDRWAVTISPAEAHTVDEHCRCGIYAVSSPLACQSYHKPGSVIAEIAVWGKTIVADQGVRGQYAYPHKLYASHKQLIVVNQLADLYGVPWQPLPVANPHDVIQILQLNKDKR